METTYYEFPVTWTNKPDTKSIGPDRPASVSYKILAIKNGNEPRFYALKLKGSPDSPAEGISWTNLKRFTGHIYVIDQQGQKLLAQKYTDGQYEAEVRFISEEKYEELQDSKLRLYETCYTETTYHYTDWYQENMDGSIVYLGTTFDGVTYNEVCTTRSDGSGGSTGGGGGTYTEYTEEGSQDYMLSYNPWIQYPEDSNYDSLYPKLTEYLRNKIPHIASNDRIVDAILKYTDLTREQVKEELQWGQGPILEVIQLDNACSNCDQKTMGLFDDSNPNIIYLDVNMVNTMEATTPGSLMGDALIFWVGTTVLHEFVHYGDGTNDNIEEGLLFEDEVYGQNVTRKNAVEILLRGSKNY